MSERTLLLDQGFQPITTISWQRAICLLTLGKCEIIEEYDRDVRSVHLVFKVPAVVRLVTRFMRNKQRVKFSRPNVLARDKWTCFGAGTRILMADGSQKPIETVVQGDRIIDAFGSPQTVVATGNQVVDKALMLKHRGSFEPTVVTPNHPFLTPNGDFVSVGDQPEYLVFPRKVNYEQYTPTPLVVASFLPQDTWFRLRGGRIYWSRRPKEKGFPTVLESSPRLAYLLGMYCAEGSASKAGLVEWSFSSKEQDTLGSDSARIIKEVFGLETTEDIDEQEHTCRIRVSSKVLSILVRSLCGRGCQGKKVPWWVARSFPAEFLKGLFLGDACIDSDRSKIALTMTSYEVIFGAQSLLWGQGIYPTVQFGHRPNRKPSWSLVLQGENYSRFMQEILGRNVPQGERIYGNDDFVFRKIQKLTPIEEEVVVVHNLETTGTHSYVANGLSVHNCQFCGQRKPTAELTYDHVIPRAQGGKTCWENIVTACGSCNHLKADRTLEQARVALAAQAKEAAQKGQEREATRLRKAAQSMRLRVEPVRPDWVPIFTVQISKNSMPDSWKSYCEWAMAKAS